MSEAFFKALADQLVIQSNCAQTIQTSETLRRLAYAIRDAMPAYENEARTAKHGKFPGPR